MFAIYRSKANIIFSNSFHYKTTCCHQSFLISKGNIFTAVNCSHCRTQACVTNHGSKYGIYFTISSRRQQTFFTGKNFSFAVITSFKTSSSIFISKHCKIRLNSTNLFFQNSVAGMSSQHANLHFIRISSSNLQSLFTNGTGTAQEGNILHNITLEQSKN